MKGSIEHDRIIQGDCVKVLNSLKEPLADLIFADPPFNIGYKYDVYEDRKKYDDYYAWTEQWMAACANKALKPAGSFWVAIGDEYAAEVKIIGDRLGLHLRNWVIWHYTFGQNTKRKFARSHTHLFYWVKDPTDFSFNPEGILVFSDRQREYKDQRAVKTVGKLPNDVWSEFPRVCGTFREREGWHPCQMPETLLARIVRACTQPDAVVLDPFAGSGTTLVVAKKLGRRFVGIELSKKYVEQSQKRLDMAVPIAPIEGESRIAWPNEHVEELRNLYGETGVPTDRLLLNPRLLVCFAQQFNWRLEVAGSTDGYTVEQIWIQLEKLRKQGKLGRLRVHAKESTSKDIRDLPLELKDTILEDSEFKK